MRKPHDSWIFSMLRIQSIQYTVERESEEGLNFLDINIKNNGTGRYEFSIHRKKAITNVQIKPSSCHDPKVLKGVFTGFVHRAFSNCSPQHIEQELDFLVNVFVENGYTKSTLVDIIKQFRDKHSGDVQEDANEVQEADLNSR